MAELEPRRVAPGTTVSFTDGDGRERTLRAETLPGRDDYAFITPVTLADEAALRALDAPVARKAIDASASDDDTPEPAPAQPELPADTTGREQEGS